jgi:hypothetical protein
MQFYHPRSGLKERPPSSNNGKTREGSRSTRQTQTARGDRSSAVETLSFYFGDQVAIMYVGQCEVMNTEDTLALLRTRAGELRQRANQKVSSIGIVSKETQTEEQGKVRGSAQSDWDTADELLTLIKQIERG